MFAGPYEYNFDPPTLSGRGSLSPLPMCNPLTTDVTGLHRKPPRGSSRLRKGIAKLKHEVAKRSRGHNSRDYICMGITGGKYNGRDRFVFLCANISFVRV